MPVGVQLVGQRGRDGALLAVAKWAEQALEKAISLDRDGVGR
jgi:Asp-tRNA(Asn)/Glu-tRNA(Gln) amidotransferase A subunit family amidase